MNRVSKTATIGMLLRRRKGRWKSDGMESTYGEGWRSWRMVSVFRLLVASFELGEWGMHYSSSPCLRLTFHIWGISSFLLFIVHCINVELIWSHLNNWKGKAPCNYKPAGSKPDNNPMKLLRITEKRKPHKMELFSRFLIFIWWRGRGCWSIVSESKYKTNYDHNISKRSSNTNMQAHVDYQAFGQQKT